MSEELLASALPVILAALAATIGTLVKEWRRKRDANQQLTRRLDLGVQECKFYDLWLDTVERHAKVPILDETYAEISASLTRNRRSIDAAMRETLPSHAPAPAAWRRLLLLGQAPTWDSKVARLAYWVWGGIVITIVVPLAASQKLPDQTWLEMLVINTLALLVFSSPLFILRWYIKRRAGKTAVEIG